MSDPISRRVTIDDLPYTYQKLATNSQQSCNRLATDYISRQDAIDALDCSMTITGRENAETVLEHMCGIRDRIKALPSVQPDTWMERNRERILQAGMEGREVEFRIGGRLFAIREKAQ